MKGLILMDLRELKWAIWGSILFFIPLLLTALYFRWGIYQVSDRYRFFETFVMISAYIPLAVLWLGSPGEGRATRLATLACLPLSRTKLALTRYAAPIVVQIVTIAIFFLTFAAFHLTKDVFYLPGTNAEWLIGRSSLLALQAFVSGIPHMLSLGFMCVAFPLLLDDLFPRARAKSSGVLVVLTISFLLSHAAFVAQNAFATFQLEFMFAFAIIVVAIEIILFRRRRIIS
jgi:hypothetical protein